MSRGCYFQEEGKVKKNMSVETAYRKSIETVMDWIDEQVNLNKTTVFFRTYSPVHFRSFFFPSLVSLMIFLAHF